MPSIKQRLAALERFKREREADELFVHDAMIYAAEGGIVLSVGLWDGQPAPKGTAKRVCEVFPSREAAVLGYKAFLSLHPASKKYPPIFYDAVLPNGGEANGIC